MYGGEIGRVAAGRRFLVSALVLVSLLACLVLALPQMLGDPSAGMRDMSGMAPVGEAQGTDAMAAGAKESLSMTAAAQDSSLRVMGMSGCEVCYDTGPAVCVGVVALLTLTLLGLLLGTLRDTFLFRQSRALVQLVSGASRLRHAWAMTSPYALCVMRT